MVATRVVMYFSGVAGVTCSFRGLSGCLRITGAMSAHRAMTSEHATTKYAGFPIYKAQNSLQTAIKKNNGK